METVEIEHKEGSLSGYICSGQEENLFIFLCAEDAPDDLMRFLEADHTEATYLVIKSLEVIEDCRGRGAGTRLLQEALDLAESAGVDATFLEADTTDTSNQIDLVDWYEKFGFETIGFFAGGLPMMVRADHDFSQACKRASAPISLLNLSAYEVATLDRTRLPRSSGVSTVKDRIP